MEISQGCVDALEAKNLDELAEVSDELAITIQTLRSWASTMPLEKLERLYHAEKEGRLRELPTKVGAFIYQIKNENGEKVIKSLHVKAINIVGETLSDIIVDRGETIVAETLGKTVFLTYNEAKQVLHC